MPGTTWVLVGAGALATAVAGVMAAREWRNRRAAPRRWRALELGALAVWTLVAVLVQVGGRWSWVSVVLVPATGVAVGALGRTLTQAGRQHWLRPPVVAVVAAVPLVVALLGQVPGLHALTVTGPDERAGSLLRVGVVWLVLTVGGATLLEVFDTRRAVGPLRTDIVRQAGVTLAGLVGVLVATLLPLGLSWSGWLPVVLVGTGLVGGRWSGDLVPLPAATSSLLDLVSDGLALVGLDGTVIDLNEIGRAHLVGDDPRTLDPALTPALAADGERTVLVRGAVLRVRTTTVRHGTVPVARVLSARDVSELERVRTELSDQVASDALTGLRNRRYLDHRLSVQIDDAHRTGRPLSIAMVDLDHLKELNDQYGHQTGDRAIVAAARVLSEGDGLAVRVGGDEFLVVLDDMDADGAELRGQLWRVAVAGLRRTPGQPLVTLSIGVAQLAPGMDAVALLSAADGALYAAKVAGRNRVRVGPVTAGAVR
ncbi:MAG: GGDEF domain-containing protein [Cellulomonas sp.]|jgi:diguanylate cyclase (GGDEF)-like protein|nr:GGDEF domain-containing protein [Cellulomonas sp.]